MEFEVQAKSNNANDIDIFLPVEILDKAFETANGEHKISKDVLKHFCKLKLRY